MSSSFYVSSRRAWTPRLWPILALGTAIIVGLALVFSLTPLEGIGLGFLIGVVIGKGRWLVWRWQHPKITVDERISDLRRAAPWN
jgi:hypothetical protein